MNKEFYHEEQYLNIESELLRGEPLFYNFKNIDGGIPLIKRQIANTDYFDTISPYGYPGIITMSNDPTILLGELERFKLFCAKERIVSTFIRMNPITNNSLLVENEYIKHIIHGRVVVVPLQASYIDIYNGYSKNHRRGLKKLENMGYTVSVEPSASIEDFIDVYNHSMRRLDAGSQYFFPLKYYHVLDKLDSEMKLIFVRDDKGEIASVSLFMVSEDIVQYHLGGTKEAFVSKSPNKLIFDFVINEYSMRKKYLILGGGLNNEEDSLFHFKYGFSKVTCKFSTLRMIHLRDQYLNLCNSINIPNREVMRLEGFFPLYRMVK